MRQRKIKDIETKLLEYSHLIVSDYERERGKWRNLFVDNTLGVSNKGARMFVEFGCGRGRFVCDLANAAQEDLFVGIEGSPSVIYRAAEKIRDAELKNVRFINAYVDDFDHVFADREINGLYLNFSDPWPKDRHEKRRLTSPNAMENYKKVLVLGGFVEQKTDNPDFFRYSYEKFKEAGFEIAEYTKDLHASEYNDHNVLTEYERKFINLGKKIMYLKAINHKL